MGFCPTTEKKDEAKRIKMAITRRPHVSRYHNQIKNGEQIDSSVHKSKRKTKLWQKWGTRDRFCVDENVHLDINLQGRVSFELIKMIEFLKPGFG